MREITLLCIAGPMKGKIFRLQGGPVFIFGRYAKANCSLASDPAASHLHFLIDTSDNRVRIIDLGSTNGLIINDKHIGGKMTPPHSSFVTLKNDDTILAGASLFQITIHEDTLDFDTGDHLVPPIPTPPVFGDADPGDMKIGVTAVLPKGATGNDLDPRLLDTDDDPSATVATALPEGIMPEIEGFTIIDKVAVGGKGVIYKAVSDDTGIYAAIKMMVFNRNKSKKQRSFEMFRREIQVTKQLHHPNIIRYIADGITLGAPYLALEYVDGGTLDELIANAPFKRLELPEAVPLFLQLMEAVAYMHSCTLVHRDIKPKNILLDVRRGGSLAVKLSDMGLTSRWSTQGADEFLPIVSEGGTPAYMPPEQLTDLTRAIPQSDVFSTAATFYHMVTGSLLYDFSDRDQTDTIIDGEIRPLQDLRPDIPTPIALVIAKALSYEPENRYQNAQEMLDAFRKALA